MKLKIRYGIYCTFIKKKAELVLERTGEHRSEKIEDGAFIKSRYCCLHRFTFTLTNNDNELN